MQFIRTCFHLDIYVYKLPKFVDNAELRMKNFEHCRIMRNTLELSDVSGGGAELFLYQSGYLTIKESDEFGYILGFPNEEVKQALLAYLKTLQG